MKISTRLTGIHVLIVDDAIDLASLFAWILRGAGARVSEAHDLSEGLASVFGGKPDVLLCDLELGGESGFALMEAVRVSEREGERHLPAAAITSVGTDQVRDECVAIGFDEFVLKPIEPQPLIDLVVRLRHLNYRPGFPNPTVLARRQMLRGTSLGARLADGERQDGGDSENRLSLH